MLDHIFIAWQYNSATIRDTSNVLRTIQRPGDVTGAWFTVFQTAGSSFQGLVVGTGLGTPQITDYKLGTQIVSGNGAGQLYHQATQHNAPVVAAPSVSIEVIRVFDNNSGADITITEVGIYCGTKDSGGVGRQICLARDLPASPVTAPSAGGARLTYTITVTV